MPNINRDVQINLTQHLYGECQVMAQHALTSGLKVPVAVIQAINEFAQRDAERCAPAELENLTIAHETLVQIVAPARPETLMLLAEAREQSWLCRTLGPVPLVRQLTVVAVLFMIIFVSLMVIMNHAQDFQMPDLLQLLYYLSAAGLGAAFAALFKANRFVMDVTFDPTFSFSYWIRFTLGLMAGLILVTLIPWGNNATSMTPALIALLGGFSSDVLYRVLTRLLVTLETAVKGSSPQLATNAS